MQVLSSDFRIGEFHTMRTNMGGWDGRLGLKATNLES